MRAPPLATHHHHRTRMVVVENITKPTTADRIAQPPPHFFNRIQRGATYARRSVQQQESTTSNTERPRNTVTLTNENNNNTFQPVEDDRTDDDDFPLEELEEASHNCLDSFDDQELDYHDLSEHGNHDDGHLPIVSDSENDADHSDMGNVQNVRGENRRHRIVVNGKNSNIDEELSKISQKFFQNVDTQSLTLKSESPILSEKGASSAFTPTKSTNSIRSPNHDSSESSTAKRDGERKSPISNQQQEPIVSSGAEAMGTRPPRPSQESLVPAGTSQPRTTITAPSSTSPRVPKARITVQTTPPKAHPRPYQSAASPPPISSTSRSNHGSFSPVAANLGELVGMSAVHIRNASSKLATTSRSFMGQSQQQQNMDTTPVVSNGRKTIITLDSSPGRNGDKNQMNETGSEHASSHGSGLAWPKSAVDQVSNAVGTIARLGHSFLQGPVSHNGQTYDPLQMPFSQSMNHEQKSKDSSEQISNNTLAEETRTTPLHLSSLLQRQGHFHPPLDQYTPALPNGQSQNDSSQDHSNQGTPATQANLENASYQHFQNQDTIGRTESALSNALDQMNLDDSSSIDQGDMPNGIGNDSYLQMGSLQYLDPALRQNQDSDTPSTYGQSQTGTEHISNQKFDNSGTAKSTPPPMSSSKRTNSSPNAKTTISPKYPKQREFKGYDISPMMRMRHKELATNDYQSVNSNGIISRSQSALSQSVQSQSLQSQSAQSHKSCTSQMTEEEFHAMKQRKWREKKKLADETREREKERLEGGSKKKRGRSKRKRLDLNTNLGACQSGLRNILSNLMDYSCGPIEDGSESDDDEESTLGESTTASEEYTRAVSEDYTRESSARSSIQSSRHQADSPSRVSSRLSTSRTEEESLDQPEETVNDGATETDGSRTEPSVPVPVAKPKIDIEKFKDKGFIKQFTSEISKEGIRFFHHREANGTDLVEPCRILVQLQLCSQGMNGKFSEPRLVINSEDDGSVLMFDIFDLRTLEKASPSKLKAFPLSLPGNSVLVRLSEGDHVFEAPDEEAAARFVHGMRWLIARLSFNLIIGNPSVSSELLELFDSTSWDEIQEIRAMNDVSNHLADKSTKFITTI